MEAQTITTNREEARRQELAKEFIALSEDLSNAEQMILALEMACTTRTVENYLKGGVRRVQFGEKLLEAAKKLIAGKV